MMSDNKKSQLNFIKSIRFQPIKEQTKINYLILKFENKNKAHFSIFESHHQQNRRIKVVMTY